MSYRRRIRRAKLEARLNRLNPARGDRWIRTKWKREPPTKLDTGWLPGQTSISFGDLVVRNPPRSFAASLDTIEVVSTTGGPAIKITGKKLPEAGYCDE